MFNNHQIFSGCKDPTKDGNGMTQENNNAMNASKMKLQR
jgi:hypothetical protein